MRFLRIEALAGGALLFCAALALILSNTTAGARFMAVWQLHVGIRLGDIDYGRTVKQWINDGLMTLFFFTGALELKREMVLGDLSSPRLATLSLAGALGGMVVPAGLFLALEHGATGAQGWGTVMATDTALMIGCLALLGSRIPLTLRLFLLSLAIFDDIGAILVVAIGYGETVNWLALGLAGLGLAAVSMIAWLGIRGIPVYCALGVGVWLAVDASGIHPTLTGVALGLMTPARSWVSDRRLHAILKRITARPPGDHDTGDGTSTQDLQRAVVATREAQSPIERLEMLLHPWVAFAIMPLFALANAGLPIFPDRVSGTMTLAILVGFVVGKPLGVTVFSALAVAARLAIRPPDLSWAILAAGSLLTGIGFTMALLIAELAFGPDLLNSAKLGILGASILSATNGLLVLWWLTRHRRT
nr:Na+/H+ antiporter NhaA [Nitrospirillum iridis]